MAILKLFRVRSQDVKAKDVKARLIHFIENMPDEGFDVEVIFQQYDSKRTYQQNRLAHLIVKAISDQVWLPDENDIPRKFTVAAWWLHLKKDYFEPEILELPDGTFVEEEPRSRDKNTKRFSAWVDQLFQFASEANVEIPEEAQEIRNYRNG